MLLVIATPWKRIHGHTLTTLREMAWHMQTHGMRSQPELEANWMGSHAIACCTAVDSFSQGPLLLNAAQARTDIGPWRSHQLEVGNDLDTFPKYQSFSTLRSVSA